MTDRELIASLSERLTSAQSANRELCLKLQLAEKNHRQLEEMYDSNWDKLHETNKLVASLQKYKRQYRDMVAIMIVIGIIGILGLAIWSVV